MNIIAVDDERLALQSLEQVIQEATEGCEVKSFLKAREALAYAEENQVDIAFLDIRMPGMQGLELAKRLKDIYGKTNIIFVTSYSEYASDAFGLRASGYILKPVVTDDIRQELNDLRRAIEVSDKGVRIQCFGNFEIFVDGRPVLFKRPKAKEILAYLVDRKGGFVSKKTLAAILWEDKVYSHSIQNHLYKLIVEIERALAEVGAEVLFIKRKGAYAVDIKRFSCDYYDFRAGKMSAINAYQGEYLAEYSWGEFTAGLLSDTGK